MTDSAWDERYGVGVPEFDADHRAMSDLAETLRYALLIDAPPAEVQALLDDLLERALAHFEREERELERTGYPEWAAHRQSHDRLLRTILHLRADVRHRRYKPDLAARFIQAWVLEHIHREDSRYVVHLKVAHAVDRDERAAQSV